MNIHKYPIFVCLPLSPSPPLSAHELISLFPYFTHPFHSISFLISLSHLCGLPSISTPGEAMHRREGQGCAFQPERSLSSSPFSLPGGVQLSLR